jgi:ubiquinone/menaquinone biosynthesis C-methylase UbiE
LYQSLQFLIQSVRHVELRGIIIVVDVGTGSGLWAMEVAKEYPNSRVIGTDISAIQPTVNVPSNCEFRLENALDGLKFDDGSVDLLHSRRYSFLHN